jgi:hypothetical protein
MVQYTLFSFILSLSFKIEKKSYMNRGGGGGGWGGERGVVFGEGGEERKVEVVRKGVGVWGVGGDRGGGFSFISK